MKTKIKVLGILLSLLLPAIVFSQELELKAVGGRIATDDSYSNADSIKFLITVDFNNLSELENVFISGGSKAGSKNVFSLVAKNHPLRGEEFLELNNLKIPYNRYTAAIPIILKKSDADKLSFVNISLSSKSGKTFKESNFSR
ncbi:MAG TPA: hypothetical protein VF691_23245 [Cytophagaceae bacterium]|jgi:hypothetical protein